MSDLRINISFSNDTAGTITATKKRKLKNKLRKKRQELQQHRYLGSKQKHNRGQSSYGQTSLYNGASTEHPTPTQNKSLPQTGATTSASQCTLPSWAFTVISKGGHEKPKEPANTKSATATTHCSSALTSHKSTTTTGLSASSSHKPTVTPGFSVLSSHKPITPSGFSTPSSHKPTSTSAAVPTKYLAIDCEMVGTGPKGHVSQLARCSLVSYNGEIVYDKFIKPTELVTDYRTRWSGIRRSDLVNAMPYSQARKEILRLLNGKVVIGHAIHNDFKVLSYSHPAALTRDTSRIPLLNRKAGFAENECASLKRLTKAIFNRDIQNGKKGHSSVEDAKATMELYKVVEQEWERSLASKSQAC